MELYQILWVPKYMSGGPLVQLQCKSECLGSKCYLLAKIKLSRNSTKFCGHLSTCEESLYSESERPWWSGTFQAVRNVKLRNLPCKSPRFLTFFQRLGCHGPGRHFRAKFEKADLA